MGRVIEPEMVANAFCEKSATGSATASSAASAPRRAIVERERRVRCVFNMALTFEWKSTSTDIRTGTGTQFRSVGSNSH